MTRIQVKWLIWISEGGEPTPRRKSPAKPTAGQALFELSSLGELLFQPGLQVCVLLLVVEEYRLLNGWGNGGKRGSTRFDRIPLALLDEVWVRGPEDCSRLLPPELPLCFTAKELGKAVGLSSKKASFAIRALRAWRAIRQVGKRGGAYLYSRVSPPGSFGPQTAAPILNKEK